MELSLLDTVVTFNGHTVNPPRLANTLSWDGPRTPEPLPCPMPLSW